MATKKKLEFGAKAAFVRSSPKTMSAKDVVEAAKKKGITLTENYVYAVKSSGSKRKGKPGRPGPKPGRKGKAGSEGMTPAESQLRAAIADLGLVRATEILEGVKTTIRGR